ncbi:hypothetical protein J3A83DRAFT_3283785 [Scleroderma citrinum]
MADAEPTVEPVPGIDAELHDEHEASDVVQGHESAAQDTLVEEAVQPDATLDDNVQIETQLQVEQDKPTKATNNEASKNPASAKAPATTSKAKSAKAAPGRPSPLSPAVKKAAPSSTAAKASPSSKATTIPTSPTLSKSISTVPSTIKKSTSISSSNPTSKTTTMSRSSAAGPAPPSRRSTMLQPRAPSATGTPPPKSRTSTLFSAFTGSAAAPKPVAPVGDVNTSVRPSVVSPSGSIASLKSTTASPGPPRPRASISDAVKRGPTTQPAVGGGPVRGIRTVGSISSIREVQDDSKVQDLQRKLQEAQGSIAEKSEAVARLERQISDLQVSLDAASADAKTKDLTIEELQKAKQASETELAALGASLRQLETERAHDLNSLNALKEELDIAKQASAGQTTLIDKLQDQITALTSEIAITQQNFESLRASSDQTSAEATAAAQAERESFLRAKTDLDALNAEMDALRAAHDTAIQDATTKLSESQQRASEVAFLTTQIEALKTEREENANKISELEVEVLELNESQEKAEDERKELLSRLKGVEMNLAQAVAAIEQAVQDAKTKEEQGAQQVAELKQAHEGEIQLLNDELAEATFKLEKLKTDVTTLESAHEETKRQAEAAAEEHERQLEESEQSYLSKHIEFSEEIKRLTTELEAMYHEKVEGVKAEHALLLQEAFERAKGEAAELHGQDLQALREESQASIEQLRTAHESFVSDLQAEQQATLDSEVNTLEQKLNSQGLELRATQDDLAKAKAALEAARLENEGLGAQLEDTRAAIVAASADANQAAEIERLTKQLASMRDENVMLNDVLAATKESLSEVSANHSKELEEAAKGRAEEVTRLRTEHEGQVSLLAAQKSELSLSLGDLENEVAMLKARLSAAESAAVPKSNGAAPSSTTHVTKEELQRVHEAHNLKMHDLQADHERVVRDLKLEVETLQNRLEEVQSDLARKNMEIQYLEQEQEESQDSITRYVKVFGLQSLFGVVIALAVIFDFI